MRKLDITDCEFGRLTVIEQVAGKRPSTWRCLCRCGNMTVVLLNNLRTGKQVSCGCYQLERSIKHGMSKTPVYHTWNAMLQRCHNPKNKAYAAYGGRGIFVYEDWHSFSPFYAYVGDKPEGLALGRLDLKRGYEPGNVQWVPPSEQENTRVARQFVFRGEVRTLTSWAKHLGVSRELIRGRMRRGASFSSIISELS